jgi:hypothetical protein
LLKISPGKEEEFRYFQEWLAANATLDRVVDATERGVDQRSSRRVTATDRALSLASGSLNKRGFDQVRGRVLDLRSNARTAGGSAMWANIYVAEKLRELDRERLAHINHVELQKLAPPRPPVFGRLAAAAGRSLRRAGETLELWATPASERETVRVALARARRSDYIYLRRMGNDNHR